MDPVIVAPLLGGLAVVAVVLVASRPPGGYGASHDSGEESGE